MIKAVFFDVDGTLVSHADGRVPLSARQAVAELRARGIRVFVATGRFRSELQDTGFLDGMTFDGYIGLNGQYCWDDERVLYTLPISKRDVRTVLNCLARNRFPCAFVGEWGLILNYVDDCVRAAQSDISTGIPPCGDLATYADRPIYQIIGFAQSPLEQSILPLLSDTRVSRWHRCGFDLLPRDGGKHNGARQLLALHGIHPDESLAIGDGANDLDLFSYLGESVAMGNASDAVKRAARYVTASVEADGVAQALKHYGLIG